MQVMLSVDPDSIDMSGKDHLKIAGGEARK